MKNENEINKQMDDVLNSMDHADRAEPRPFLLARIQAKLINKNVTNSWDRLTSIITRPAIAFTAVLFLLLLNVFIITNKVNGEEPIPESENPGFSIAVTNSIYDFENP